MLAAIITGTPRSLLVGLIAAGIGMLVGIMLGFTAGFLGGWVDTIIRTIADCGHHHPIAGGADRHLLLCAPD